MYELLLHEYITYLVSLIRHEIAHHIKENAHIVRFSTCSFIEIDLHAQAKREPVSRGTRLAYFQEIEEFGRSIGRRWMER